MKICIYLNVVFYSNQQKTFANLNYNIVQPICCAENKKIFWTDLFLCLRMCILFETIIFHELISYLTPNSCISFRFHLMHTTKHRTTSVGFFLSIPYAPFIHSFIHLVTTQLFSTALPMTCDFHVTSLLY